MKDQVKVPDILEMITEDVADQVASDLIDCIVLIQEEGDDAGSVDFSYDVSAGKIVIQDANTWLYFDLPQDSMAYQLLVSMYDREMDEQEEKQIYSFLCRISNLMIENHEDRLREAIREIILPGSQEDVIPLGDIKVLDIEMVDYSSVDDENRHLMKVKKIPGTFVDIQELSSELMRIKDESDGIITNEEIVERERLAGNPVFTPIMTVDKGDRYLWDISATLFVDYSMSDEAIDHLTTAQEKMKEESREPEE
jgi:hypothetical protein